MRKYSLVLENFMFIRQMWSFLREYTFYTVLFCSFLSALVPFPVGCFITGRGNMFRQRPFPPDLVDTDIYLFIYYFENKLTPENIVLENLELYGSWSWYIPNDKN